MQFHFTACQSLKVKHLNYFSHLTVCSLCVNCQQLSLFLNKQPLAVFRIQGYTMLLNIPVSMRKRSPLEDICRNRFALLSSEKNSTSNFNDFTLKNKTKQKLQQNYLGSVVPPNCHKKSKLKTNSSRWQSISWHSSKPWGQIIQQTSESTI